MGYADELFDHTAQAQMRAELRERESRLVCAVLNRERFVDFPSPLGGTERYVLPRTWFGGRWALWRAGYRWGKATRRAPSLISRLRPPSA